MLVARSLRSWSRVSPKISPGTVLIEIASANAELHSFSPSLESSLLMARTEAYKSSLLLIIFHYQGVLKPSKRTLFGSTTVSIPVPPGAGLVIKGLPGFKRPYSMKLNCEFAEGMP